MAQRQCMTPFRSLATHLPPFPRPRSNLLHRTAQCRPYTQHHAETSSPRWQERSLSTEFAKGRDARRTKSISSPKLKANPSTARTFSTTSRQHHGDLTPPKPGEERHITFIDKEGQQHDFEVSDGDNLLDIAQANDLEMEGACGGSCACSTCHVIVDGDELYDKMEEPSDDENDMLDLAFGLTETSRLGCQVKMSKALDGLVVSRSSA